MDAQPIAGGLLGTLPEYRSAVFEVIGFRERFKKGKTEPLEGESFGAASHLEYVIVSACPSPGTQQTLVQQARNCYLFGKEGKNPDFDLSLTGHVIPEKHLESMFEAVMLFHQLGVRVNEGGGFKYEAEFLDLLKNMETIDYRRRMPMISNDQSSCVR